MARILLVEDNEENMSMLTRRLMRAGHDVLAAVNGVEGMNQAHAQRPDLILMDMSMPVLDGWEATRQLKADPGTRSIPIVGLSAHAMVGDEEKAIEAGCDDYDTKPVEWPRLKDKIERLLKGRK
jgi:two-component system cell cycle response regulator DivK